MGWSDTELVGDTAADASNEGGATEDVIKEALPNVPITEETKQAVERVLIKYLKRRPMTLKQLLRKLKEPFEAISDPDQRILATHHVTCVLKETCQVRYVGKEAQWELRET